MLSPTDDRILFNEDTVPQISWVQRSLTPVSSKPYTSNLFGLDIMRCSTSLELNLHLMECKTEDGGTKVDTTRMVEESRILHLTLRKLWHTRIHVLPVPTQTE